jgi:hypothetical protein
MARKTVVLVYGMLEVYDNPFGVHCLQVYCSHDPLFPERKAYTVKCKLSNIEVALYESVTHYVQTEMGKADQLDGSRKGSVGFALTALQRRLASSPEAIFQSLKRLLKIAERACVLRTGQVAYFGLARVLEDEEKLRKVYL